MSFSGLIVARALLADSHIDECQLFKIKTDAGDFLSAAHFETACDVLFRGLVETCQDEYFFRTYGLLMGHAGTGNRNLDLENEEYRVGRSDGEYKSPRLLNSISSFTSQLTSNISFLYQASSTLSRSSSYFLSAITF